MEELKAAVADLGSLKSVIEETVPKRHQFTISGS